MLKKLHITLNRAEWTAFLKGALEAQGYIPEKITLRNVDLVIDHGSQRDPAEYKIEASYE